MKQLHPQLFLHQFVAAALAAGALAAGAAAQGGAMPDASVTVHVTHYEFGGRAFDDADSLRVAIDAKGPRAIDIDACGPGATRPLLVAGHRLRAWPLRLRSHDSGAPACATPTALAMPVGLRAMRNDDAVDGYWRSLEP